MTYRDDILRTSDDYVSMPMPIALYCAYSDCQTLIPIGEPVKKFDGCTFVHIACPKTPLRNFAAHKQPDSGMRFR